MNEPESLERRCEDFRKAAASLFAEIGKAVVGHEEVVRQTVAAILAGGHALLEGVPGIGKTLLVRTLAQCMSLKFQRIQFTPDLMPADITGTNLVAEGDDGRRRFEFHRGPIFGNLILADEVNRATPKTQSALLEAMQEQAVTAGGSRYALEAPFFVLATQNPIEMEGTYPLPEAQVDRFLFKILVTMPSLEGLLEVLDRTTGRPGEALRAVLSGPQVLAMQALVRELPAPKPVLSFAARLVLSTHPDSAQAIPLVKKYVRYGASPRAGQALLLAGKVFALLAGRPCLSFEDVRAAAKPALRHRIILGFDGEAEGVRTDAIVQKLLEEVPEAPGRAGELLGKA
ncbi:MAG: AAA family ATPase [Planctomycetota bacterium]